MILSSEFDVPTDAKAQELWRACYSLQRQELESIGMPMIWTDESKAALYLVDWEQQQKNKDLVLCFLKKVKNLYDLNLTPEALERAELQAKAALLDVHSPVSMFAELVETFLRRNPQFYDTKTKMFWRWSAEESKWEICDDVDVLRVFNEKYSIMEWIIPSIRMKILDTLKVFAAKKPKDVPLNYIQFKKKVYDMNTENVFEASPEYFFTTPIPHELGISEDAPTITRFFGEWVKGEKDYQALNEIAAYIPYRAYPIQRVFVLHGEGANGKSTYLRLLRNLFGTENVTTSDYDRLSDGNQRFERAKLQNKLMCQLGELENKQMEKTSVLKELTSGTDLISAEFKGKNPFDFLNFAKLIIATNKVPLTFDKSDAFYRRFNSIDFPFQFKDSKDILAEIPEWEYENFLLKCLRILKELLKNGAFANDGSIEERRMRYEALSNPIKKYIEETYDADQNGYIIKAGFKEEFVAYLKNNRMVVMNDHEISRALKACGYVEKKKRIGEETYTVIIGIKLKDVPDVPDVPLFSN